MPAASSTVEEQHRPAPLGYSPLLRIMLEVGEQRFEVAETGRDFLVLRDAANVPPCDAVLYVAIDGDVKSRPVRLPAGIDAGREDQPVRSL